MKKPDAQFKLRLPNELKGALERSCERTGETLTGEIVKRLETSFDVRSDVRLLLSGHEMLQRLVRSYEQMIQLYERAHATVQAGKATKAEMSAALAAAKTAAEEIAHVAKKALEPAERIKAKLPLAD